MECDVVKVLIVDEFLLAVESLTLRSSHLRLVLGGRLRQLLSLVAVYSGAELITHAPRHLNINTIL